LLLYAGGGERCRGVCGGFGLVAQRGGIWAEALGAAEDILACGFGSVC